MHRGPPASSRLQLYFWQYITEGNKKFSITSEVQLAEALSLVKKGMITMCVDPRLPQAKKSLISTLGKKRKGILILS